MPGSRALKGCITLLTIFGTFRKTEAVEVFYLLAIDAGVTDALLNYGSFFWGEGKLRQAIPFLERAYEAHDQHAALTLGQIYLNSRMPTVPSCGFNEPAIIRRSRCAWPGPTRLAAMRQRRCAFCAKQKTSTPRPPPNSSLPTTSKETRRLRSDNTTRTTTASMSPFPSLISTVR